MKKLLIVLFLFVLLKSHGQVPNFTLTNVTTGSTVSLDSYSTSANSGVVIIFTSNACPYDEYYRARIAKLAKDFGEKVPVLLVNSHTESNEAEEAMKKKANEAGFTVPYLADKDQLLMRNLKATKSPQAFLLKNDGGIFSVIYSGAIDDNAQVEGDVRAAYLQNAVSSMISNKPITAPDVRPVGCSIKKK
jgi:peroxiredoxin